MRSRDEIKGVVFRHIRMNLSDMDDVAIDPSQSLVQYGASSLDLIEIVSASLRELSMRIPRTEFADLRTIDDFIELMWQYEQRGAPRAEATPEPGA